MFPIKPDAAARDFAAMSSMGGANFLKTLASSRRAPDTCADGTGTNAEGPQNHKAQTRAEKTHAQKVVKGSAVQTRLASIAVSTNTALSKYTSGKTGKNSTSVSARRRLSIQRKAEKLQAEGKDASAQGAEENDGLDEPMIQNGVNFASAGDAVHTIFSFMFILTPLLIGFVRCEVLVGQGGLSLFEVIMLCFVIASPIGGTYSTLSVVFRTWMLAMTLSISRRCEHLELLGELLDDGGDLPQILPTIENLNVWMDLRKTALHVCVNVHRRCEFIISTFFLLFFGIFLCIAITTGANEEEALVLHEYVHLLTFFALGLLAFGSFASKITNMGDRYNDIARRHVRKLAHFARVTSVSSATGSTDTGTNSAKALADEKAEQNLLIALVEQMQQEILSTQELEPMELMGLIPLDTSSFRAIIAFVAFDVSLLISRIEWH